MSGWRTQAACLGMDARLFFAARDDASYIAAKRVCRECPVFDDCREYALDAKEDEGCWGGLNPKERRSLRRQRRTNERATLVLLRQERAS